jgi:peptidoglycan/xylan/chitin deacetylase (PgdA/CDA1 family)
MGHRLLVLGWHNVEPTWCFPARSGAGRSGLQRQSAYLARFANVVPLDDALRALDEGRPLPPRAVALTFDDGVPRPAGAGRPDPPGPGLPATFFLVPGLLDGTASPWWEVLGWLVGRATGDAVVWEGRTLGLRGAAERRSSLRVVGELLNAGTARQAAIQELTDRCRPLGPPAERARFMDWADARELARRGFAIGSHSQQHAILSEESDAEQRRDLAVSRRQLELELEVPVELLCYPNGTPLDYDHGTIAAAQDAGYSHAVTTITGWNEPTTPCFEIRRFMLQPERGVAGLSIVPLDPAWRRLRRLRRRPATVSGGRPPG